ncbi:MAG: sigma-70 family RNA polymerase sigma factor [Paludibacteraceae bacterium]|nr:sigma-70 family RNA polymerase sigma factor [Paludibacteraceae bacterium]
MINTKSMTDEELVQLYEGGVNEAFDALLLRHKDKVFSNIFLSVRDRDIANDIFQETFIKVICTIKQGKYTEKGKFSAWVMRIAHNLIIDQFRVEKSENTVSNDDDDRQDLFDTIQLYDDNIEDVMVKEQVYEDVVNLMNHLPDNQKEVLKMRFFEDLSFKEIADATGVSINTALGRMRYAVMNLRKLAEDNDVTLWP